MGEEQKELGKKEETKKDKPVVFRVGGIKLSEFTNTHEGREYKNVKVSRVYKTGDEWKETDSFSPNDLVKLRLAVDEYLRFKNPMKVD